MRGTGAVLGASGIALVFAVSTPTTSVQPTSVLTAKTVHGDTFRSPTSTTSTSSSTTTAPVASTTTTTRPTTTTTAVTGSGTTVQKSATTSTTSTAQTPTNCGGQSLLVADGVTWHCTFDDEFGGTALNRSNWVVITTAASGYTQGLTACFVDSPNNVSVANGYLNLTVRKEAAPFTCQDPFGNFTTQYTSGTLASYQLFSQTYGRFEVLAKVPASAVAGLQSAFWLFPESLYQTGPWPSGGEIDIGETYSVYPGYAIPYFHYLYNSLTTNYATNTNTVTNTACTINPNQFNDYLLDWTPTTLTVKYNGTTCLVDHWQATSPTTPGAPFNQPFFVCLTQELGIANNNFDPSMTPLPATTQVKFVRVWQGSF